MSTTVDRSFTFLRNVPEDSLDWRDNGAQRKMLSWRRHWICFSVSPRKTRKRQSDLTGGLWA